MGSPDQRERLDDRARTVDPGLPAQFVGRVNRDLMIWFNSVIGDPLSPVLLPNFEELQIDLLTNKPFLVESSDRGGWTHPYLPAMPPAPAPPPAPAQPA